MFPLGRAYLNDKGFHLLEGLSSYVGAPALPGSFPWFILLFFSFCLRILAYILFSSSLGQTRFKLFSLFDCSLFVFIFIREHFHPLSTGITVIFNRLVLAVLDVRSVLFKDFPNPVPKKFMRNLFLLNFYIIKLIRIYSKMRTQLVNNSDN